MNRIVPVRFLFPCTVFALVCGIATLASAQTRTLRIVAYNIDADTGGYTINRPGLISPPGGTVQQGGVLEGIGEEVLGSDAAQPIDILALEETTKNTTTVTPIVNGLNTYYNAPGMYAMSSYQATSTGGTGGGPSALIYNTNTVQLLASVPVDPTNGVSHLGSTSGEYREVMRYEFAPAGETPTAANEFYIYVSHYKASTGSANESYRYGEAQIIRNNSATLPSTARILYVGDYNPTGGSSEAGYQEIIAPGVNQGIDPMNPSGATGIDWSGNSLMVQKTESATDLLYRDDLQVMTTNVYYGLTGGLAYVSGTYHVFGNNGTTPYGGSVGSGNSALTNIAAGAPISAAQLYQDLAAANATDHLPIVADYTIPISAPNMAVSPASSFASTGNPGGPFSPSSQVYGVTNTGTGSLDWTASKTADWVTLSATSGTLVAGAGTTVTVSINSSANSLVSGTYTDTVSFTNTSNGAGNATRGVSLTVSAAPAQLALGPASGFSSSGLVGGPFIPASQTYSLTNVGGTTMNWTASTISSWLMLSATAGTLPAGATTDVTVSISPNAIDLEANTYSDTVSFSNTSNGAGNTTRPVSLTVNAIPPVALFTAAPTSGAEPLLVTFSDTSSGTITNRAWDFGDGATTNATAAGVTHTYAAGSYTVNLIASGPGGTSTNTRPNYITVLTAFQAWQVRYFGSTSNPDAAPDADPDHDGMSNWAEFLVGTDPTDSASVLRITGITKEGNDIRVTWTMGSGKTNVLQRAEAMDGPGSFSDLFTVLAEGTVTNYLDVGALTNASNYFYRVRLGP